jgi:hypothetical protein
MNRDIEERLVEALRREGVEKPKMISFDKELDISGNWVIFPVLRSAYKFSLDHQNTKWDQ